MYNYIKYILLTFISNHTPACDLHIKYLKKKYISQTNYFPSVLTPIAGTTIPTPNPE